MRNRNQVMKAKDRERRRAMDDPRANAKVNVLPIMETEASDTPRTNRFVDGITLALPQDMMRDYPNVVFDIRRLMIDYAGFARDLERELNRSIPQEWMSEPPHRRIDS